MPILTDQYILKKLPVLDVNIGITYRERLVTVFDSYIKH